MRENAPTMNFSCIRLFIKRKVGIDFLSLLFWKFYTRISKGHLLYLLVLINSLTMQSYLDFTAEGGNEQHLSTLSLNQHWVWMIENVYSISLDKQWSDDLKRLTTWYPPELKYKDGDNVYSSSNICSLFLFCRYVDGWGYRIQLN